MKKVLIIMSVVLFIAILAGLSAVIVTHNASNSDVYKVGNDTIPSIKSVVGKRKVVGVATSTENGVTKKTYSYTKMQSLSEDLIQFTSNIEAKKGFIPTKDTNLNLPSGSGQWCVESLEAGKILIMDIAWNIDSLEITLTLGKGALTANEDIASEVEAVPNADITSEVDTTSDTVSDEM